ncbi:zona pellucida sperm-binding protein 3 isoform X1 [Astyanax mexicanus]|uniref:zona pellucida sperm-binding protein 3 isoform X1 n=1 Tax=Astyanax mexicanus TaxID=7994 RepID=UPI0020CB0BAD|nr:zona pellucida sperm-binding protein 3 isoform X1 [Astyanax mexicanus]
MGLIQGGLLLLFVVSTLSQRDLVIDCKANTVTVKWRPALNSAQKVDISQALLGRCRPSSVAENVLLFSVWIHDCGFRRQVVEDKVTYTNLLTYGLDSGVPSIVKRVECIYDSSGKTTYSEKAKNDLVFTLEFMNSDFTEPAQSSMFTLDSRIHIKAEVEQQDSESLQIYLQSCVLATSPDLPHASQLHTVISNSGCLTESKEGNSAFLPRRRPSEILFYFQASALGENIFLHCEMAARDPQSFSADIKACQYMKEQKSWMLLDHPSQSYICSCCDTGCTTRTNLVPGTTTQKVLGPFAVVEPQNKTSGTFWTAEEELSGVPVWVVVVTVPMVLLLLAGAIATGYYLCFWRGGRIGYRPRRDLLTKY